MSVGSWSKHYRHVWEERSGDANLPNWFRVTSLAYGTHAANGHANFRRSVKGTPGDVAMILGNVDPATGEITPAHKDAVLRAIDTAVSYGLLGPGSHAGCLIVPGHAVSFGMGDERKRCPVDHVRARRKHDRLVALSAA